MDRKTIEDRLAMSIATVCLAATSGQPGDVRLAKECLLDVVEDLTKEAVTDHRFLETFGEENPSLSLTKR